MRVWIKDVYSPKAPLPEARCLMPLRDFTDSVKSGDNFNWHDRTGDFWGEPDALVRWLFVANTLTECMVCTQCLIVLGYRRPLLTLSSL